MPRAPGLRQLLLTWFDRHQRDLPWRRTQDPYAIWVSEIMLQQTQVATVIPYRERFLRIFPTVNILAEASEDAVFAQWKGLGYYSRARNLHAAAKQVVAEHGGQFPKTAAELRELPGFGRYTAGAVASIAFGEEAALVDGNVARVFSRLFAVEGAPGDKAREARLWEIADGLVVGERPGIWNQALMELGALVCRMDSPTCLLCPVRSGCQALKQGRVSELPPVRVRAERKHLRLQAAVWRRGEGVLLAKRAGRGLFGGLWELPSAEATDGEALGETLARACGVKIQVVKPLGEVRRVLTHRNLEIALTEVTGRMAPSKNEVYAELRFVTPAEALALGISKAMQEALRAAG